MGRTTHRQARTNAALYITYSAYREKQYTPQQQDLVCKYFFDHEIFAHSFAHIKLLRQSAEQCYTLGGARGSPRCVSWRRPKSLHPLARWFHPILSRSVGYRIISRVPFQVRSSCRIALISLHRRDFHYHVDRCSNCVAKSKHRLLEHSWQVEHMEARQTSLLVDNQSECRFNPDSALT